MELVLPMYIMLILFFPSKIWAKKYTLYMAKYKSLVSLYTKEKNKTIPFTSFPKTIHSFLFWLPTHTVLGGVKIMRNTEAELLSCAD